MILGESKINDKVYLVSVDGSIVDILSKDELEKKIKNKAYDTTSDLKVFEAVLKKKFIIESVLVLKLKDEEEE
jgi:hypothetical protein